MAQILKEVLGNLLYILPVRSESYKLYPSPSSLLNKVLVKGSGDFETAAKILNENYTKMFPIENLKAMEPSEDEYCESEGAIQSVN